jgi:hypothetical protein
MTVEYKFPFKTRAPDNLKREGEMYIPLIIISTSLLNIVCKRNKEVILSGAKRDGKKLRILF